MNADLQSTLSQLQSRLLLTRRALIGSYAYSEEPAASEMAAIAVSVSDCLALAESMVGLLAAEAESPNPKEVH